MSSRAKDLKRQLATESLQALIRLRQTGQPPSSDDSPLLMAIWQAARDAFIAEGPSRCRFAHRHQSLQFLVTTSWGVDNDLLKFLLHDKLTGSLLLVGDANGPVFPPPKNTGI